MGCGKEYKEVGYELVLNEDNYLVSIIILLLFNIIVIYCIMFLFNGK